MFSGYGVSIPMISSSQWFFFIIWEFLHFFFILILPPMLYAWVCVIKIISMHFPYRPIHLIILRSFYSCLVNIFVHPLLLSLLPCHHVYVIMTWLFSKSVFVNLFISSNFKTFSSLVLIESASPLCDILVPFWRLKRRHFDSRIADLT